MIKKILIANRGEIAVRIMRACREMGIRSVAIYSEADKEALFAKYADEAYLIGPSPASQSYLNMEKIIQTAKECGADAIHPGYGFLAENPVFAIACEKANIKFIGPTSKILSLMGDKVTARREMVKAGIPVVPGTDVCVTDYDQARSIVEEIGYPVIIKPSGGGGGIGMTVVSQEQELEKALESTKVIASTTFGVGDVYIEKYLVNPRHIEFQILADSHGNAIHLGERECSIQRRHQKLLEESPSPAVTDETRSTFGQLVANAASMIGYEGAGTMEFLFKDEKFYFLEMNTRVQVEHPVTEMVTGVDIVKEGIRIASGCQLSIQQNDIRINGSAIECRINAEDPLNDFVPTPGKIKHYHPPGGNGIRVDSGVYPNFAIPPFYDSMISKLIVWDKTRADAIDRMKRALYEYIITGVKTNMPFHQALMENQRFIEGRLGTHFIETEKSLKQDMRDFIETEISLMTKLPISSSENKKIAAIAAVSSVMRKKVA
ncbi:acetyl-CoA carboxylase, biotin carboxylase subunit [Desulfosarcina cetonica]|uniref:acetyl-CoA carboxylase biotin carboxylase subunit n=1 Tax=Desulfosarcina cetonica TaxID=90730 RepID=UPI0006CFE8B8|nr:acetyl-CoA carboxylase biotin carboxylase subunit [Desulfosarcina cetonica]VTR67878.1 acetyl-CoA carboxylase, biotin carboxylase subunit [Desulfosarcina cetonica]